MNWRVRLALWLLKPYSYQVQPYKGSIPIVFADVNAVDFDDAWGKIPVWLVPARSMGGRPLADSFYTVYAPHDPKEAV